MEERAAPSVALESAAEPEEAMLEASLAAELATEEAAELAPEATEEAPDCTDERADPAPEVAEAMFEPAADVMLFKIEVTSLPTPEVIPPRTEDTRELTWALAAPAAATATKMVEKRMLMFVVVWGCVLVMKSWWWKG